MRAILLGNKDLAVRALDVLARHRVEVAGIVLNPDDDGVEQGRWYRSLKVVAEARAIPTIQPRHVSTDEGREFIVRHAPDFLLSVSYARIVRKMILELPRRLALNVHFSELPHCRGCLPLVYAMAGGDAHTGVTLHVMDEGIDTGDILAARRVEIDDCDTARTLYFKCVEAGETLLDETLPALVRGTFDRRPQQLDRGSYHPQVYPHDRWLDPGMSARQFSCFVRAHTFPPYPSARAMVDGAEHEVLFRDGKFFVPELGIDPAPVDEVIAALLKRNWESICPPNLVSTN